jgi:hypothetical protein
MTLISEFFFHLYFPLLNCLFSLFERIITLNNMFIYVYDFNFRIHFELLYICFQLLIFTFWKSNCSKWHAYLYSWFQFQNSLLNNYMLSFILHVFSFLKNKCYKWHNCIYSFSQFSIIFIFWKINDVNIILVYIYPLNSPLFSLFEI